MLLLVYVFTLSICACRCLEAKLDSVTNNLLVLTYECEEHCCPTVASCTVLEFKNEAAYDLRMLHDAAVSLCCKHFMDNRELLCQFQNAAQKSATMNISQCSQAVDLRCRHSAP